MNANSQIFSHDSAFNGTDDGFFELVAPVVEVSIIIQLSSVQKSSSPGEDRSNTVGTGFVSLLMFSIMSCDSSMGSFSLNNVTRGL